MMMLWPAAVFLLTGLASTVEVLGLRSPSTCSFAEEYPRHYVAHRASEKPTLDGKLDEQFWEEVPWTDEFVDIAQGATPHKKTRAKMRWDNEFLYVGALLEEDEVWANMKDNEVIFKDNDFEVFVDPGGSTQYYKEFEINAANAKWYLCLNKPYSNGGYENSTRVFGAKGYGMAARSAVHIDGVLNDASVASRSWSVEVALPMTDLLVNQTDAAAAAVGSYWRLDFSRVEWRVDREGKSYRKSPPQQSEYNWVWQPIGLINMHIPERWGILQFADERVGATPVVQDPSWSARHVAAAVYDAEMAWSKEHDGHFTDSLAALSPFAPAGVLDGGSGSCTRTAKVTVGADLRSFEVRVASLSGGHTAVMSSDRRVSVEGGA